MIHSTDTLAFITAGLLLDSTLKATILLAATAMLAGTAFRRTSAATRHLLWATALLAILLLPAMTARLPVWHILPQWTATSFNSVPVAQFAPPLVQDFNELPSSSPSTPVGNGSETDERLAVGSPDVTESRNATAAPFIHVENVTDIPAHRSSPGRLPLMDILWGIGVILCSLPVVLSLFFFHRQRRGARTLLDPSWQNLSHSLRMQFHIRRRVRLLLLPDNSIPTTFGFFAPAILLPQNALTWDENRRRIVLLHELAHIQRLDNLTLFLANLVRALYWFHPLVWLATHRLHIERERACDDLVLAHGPRAPDYADTLLHIVVAFQQPSMSTLSMARASTLESRLAAILNPRQNRRKLARVYATVLVLISLGLIIPLSMLGARTHGSDSPSNPTVTPITHALIDRLASPDFATREAAQKELDAVPWQQRDDLARLADQQSDPEIEARLQNRIDQIYRQLSADPPPVTVHVKNADLQTLTDALSHAMGTVTLREPPSPPGETPPSASFTLDADSQPFWDVYAQLSRQHFFEIQVAGQPQPTSNIYRLENYQRYGPFAIFQSTASIRKQTDPQAAPGSDPNLSFMGVQIFVAADPRMTITQASKPMSFQVVDEAGNAVPQTDPRYGLMPPNLGLSAPRWYQSVGLLFPIKPGQKLYAVGKARFTVLVSAIHREIEDIEKQVPESLQLGAYTLSLDPVTHVKPDNIPDVHFRLMGQNNSPRLIPTAFVHVIDATGRRSPYIMPRLDNTVTQTVRLVGRSPFKLAVTVPEKVLELTVPFKLPLVIE